MKRILKTGMTTVDITSITHKVAIYVSLPVLAAFAGNVTLLWNVHEIISGFNRLWV